MLIEIRANPESLKWLGIKYPPSTLAYSSDNVKILGVQQLVMLQDSLHEIKNLDE